MMKKCYRCKDHLPEADFYPDRTTKDGLSSKCKTCKHELLQEHYWKKRGIAMSRDLYFRMLESQGGLCAICGANEPGSSRSYFDVDHDHETGQVRGLLCGKCNRALGLFGDDLSLIEKAVDYLKSVAISP